MTGAGKSFAMDDLLTQTQAGYDYTVIIEEGLPTRSSPKAWVAGRS